MTANSAARTAALGLAAAVASSSCGSSGSDAAPGMACDPCVDGSAGNQQASNTNPDGVAYPEPAGGYGRTARSGNTPGSVIQNFKFLGYPNADRSQGLQPIAFADYYDPCNKRYTLIHLTVASVWCEPCNQETTALVAAQQDLTSKRTVVLQALNDGPTQGVPASTIDLDYWLTNHRATFTEMLDPGLKNLSGFFTAAAVPWNCDIDPRTMEIVDASVGWAGDVDTELQSGLAAVQGMPSYPVPVQCN